MSNHKYEFEDGETKHGKGCLTRHVSHFAVSNPCSHRGQAWHQAKDKEGGAGAGNTYSWPRTVDGPKKPDAWDFGKEGNFKRSSRKPWWHEAHHIVPNAELRNSIRDLGADSDRALEIVQKVKDGLLAEGYNLNNKVNMIILPMEEEVSDVIGLPLHRQTPGHFSHEAYSAQVKKELDKRLSPMKAPAGNCKKLPPYKASRQKIEKLSNTLYDKIKKTKARALDNMKIKAKFRKGSPP